MESGSIRRRVIAAVEVKVPVGEVLTLDRLNDYVFKSVVSKTVIGKKAGTVTTLALDLSEGLSAHTAPFDALVQIPESRAQIMIAEETNVVETGESIILPADVQHAQRTRTNVSRCC